MIVLRPPNPWRDEKQEETMERVMVPALDVKAIAEIFKTAEIQCNVGVDETIVVMGQTKVAFNEGDG